MQADEMFYLGAFYDPYTGAYIGLGVVVGLLTHSQPSTDFECLWSYDHGARVSLAKDGVILDPSQDIDVTRWARSMYKQDLYEDFELVAILSPDSLLYIFTRDGDDSDLVGKAFRPDGGSYPLKRTTLPDEWAGEYKLERVPE